MGFPASTRYLLDSNWYPGILYHMLSAEMDPKHKIEAGCHAIGISVAELARRVGRPRQYLYSVMSGRKPGTGIWEDIARVLECDVRWLTTGSGPAPRWAAPKLPASSPDAQAAAAIANTLDDIIQLAQALEHAPDPRAGHAVLEQLIARATPLRDDLRAIVPDPPTTAKHAT